jgi:hypothetical protein
MSLLHRNRLEIKLGAYATGQPAALTDPWLLSRAQECRRHLAARMLPLDVGDVRKRLPPAAYHVSLKVDGEFNLLVYADGEILTVNPGGTVRVGLPLMTEAAELLKKAGVNQAIIAGELHYVRADGKRPRVHDVCRVARRPASLGELDGLRFAPFDLVEIEGKAPAAAFDQTWQRLTGIFGVGTRCRVVEAVWLKDAAAIERHYRHWVEKGAEGAVVRSDVAGMFKIKPRHSIDAVVIGFTEGAGERRGMIHDLLVALMRADGCLHVLGHVSVGFRDAERRNLLSDLKDLIVPSDYVEVSDQVAYHMVRPACVIEISVLDLIAQSTRNAPINKMVLHWNTLEKRYRIVRRLPLVSLISPHFVRRREDKSVNPTDLRLQQVSELVEVAMIDRDARQLNLSRSQVLRREVYTKQFRGQTMVRKLVLWQTNKQRETEGFPGFVIHFTDYSPQRQAPLERDIRVSNSRGQIDELWNDLVKQNIAKGWVKVGGAARVMGTASGFAALAQKLRREIDDSIAEPVDDGGRVD